MQTALSMPFAWVLPLKCSPVIASAELAARPLSTKDFSAASLSVATSTDNPPTPISLSTDAVDCTSRSLSPPQTTVPAISV